MPSTRHSPGRRAEERQRFGHATADGRTGASGRVRFLVALGFPAFGLAAASTVVSTYLPVLVERLSGPLAAGLLIGGEGVVGLFLPALVGSWSDSTRSRLGPRLPFVLVATAVGAAALVLLPFLGSVLAVALAVLVFYMAYFAYYTPYRALYSDLVEQDVRGRAVGLQGTWRSVGMLGAMAGGGVLLGLWQPLPFLAGAAALTLGTVVLYGGVSHESRRWGARNEESGGSWRLLRDRADLRLLFAANSLWEFTVAALKTFVVLFITVGLGRSLNFTSLVLAAVGVAAVFAAPFSGWSADRFGHARVLKLAILPFGLGLTIPLFTVSAWALPLVPIVAFAAVVLITVPYSLLMGLMPPDEHGAASGLFGLSRGVGTLLGPLVTGGAIQLLQPVLPATKGYSALFAVTSAAILLSYPLVRGVERRMQEGAR
ncbi:MAG: MFS transporter [Thermoleophilaceae bacterium]